MTTKEQERKALEKIKKIVAELGEGSYIGIAFEGCFEIAEENIDNDFACSMKQRVDNAVKEMAEQMNTIREYEEKIKEMEIELEAAENKIKELQSVALDPDDLVDFGQMLDEEIFKRTEIMKKEAETIVAMADTPNDIAFQNAVRIHRNAMTDKKYYEGIAARIQRARTSYNA